MKSKFEITISKVEELGPGPFEYKISLDSMVQHLFSTDTFEIFGSGQLSLGIIANDEELGGVTFPMEILKGFPCLWFPVEAPFKGLTAIAEEVTGPRVLLLVTENTTLSPIAEVSERSLASILPLGLPESTCQEVYIEALTAELEWKDAEIETFAGLLARRESELKDSRQLHNELKGLYSDFVYSSGVLEAGLREEIKGTQCEVREVTGKNEELQLHIAGLRESATVAVGLIELPVLESAERPALKDSEAKRKALRSSLKALVPAESDTVPNPDLLRLERENQSLLGQIQVLTDELKLSEEKQLAVPSPEGEASNEGIIREIYTLVSKLACSQRKKKGLMKSLESVKEQNAQYRGAIESLKSSLAKQREDNSIAAEQLKVALLKAPESHKGVDRALREYIQLNGLKNSFSRVSEGLYNYNGAQVHIRLSNGVPVIHSGDSSVSIENFLSSKWSLEDSENRTDLELSSNTGKDSWPDCALSRPTKSSLLKRRPSTSKVPNSSH